MYVRKVGDRTLTLGVSGNLWKDVLVLFDRETDSLWTQLNGSGIQGEMAGKQLEEIPSEMSTWAEWKSRYPHTVVLKKSAPLEGSRYDRYASHQTEHGMFGSENPDGRLGGKELIYGVKLPQGKAVAVTAARMELESAVVTRLGEDGILLTQSPAGGVVAHLLPGLSQPDLALAKPWKDGKLMLSNGSVIDLDSGRIQSGPGKGTELERLPVTRAYWFAWAAFYPHSEVAVAVAPE